VLRCRVERVLHRHSGPPPAGVFLVSERRGVGHRTITGPDEQFPCDAKFKLVGASDGDPDDAGIMSGGHGEDLFDVVPGRPQFDYDTRIYLSQTDPLVRRQAIAMTGLIVADGVTDAACQRLVTARHRGHCAPERIDQRFGQHPGGDAPGWFNPVSQWWSAQLGGLRRTVRSGHSIHQLPVGRDEERAGKSLGGERGTAVPLSSIGHKWHRERGEFKLRARIDRRRSGSRDRKPNRQYGGDDADHISLLCRLSSTGKPGHRRWLDEVRTALRSRDCESSSGRTCASVKQWCSSTHHHFISPLLTFAPISSATIRPAVG
jgi:hypothetical protein